MPQLTFWFEFASTYSYLSAMRIDEVASAEGVEVVWQPFLLGPIFAEQGWKTSPFNLFPAKGAYMVRDIDRTASDRGVPFGLPKVFPANGLKAARLALVGQSEGWIAPFAREVFAAQFRDQANIADATVLTSALEKAGQDAAKALKAADEPEVKERLRHNTNMAKSLGIFGAPSFTAVDDELFWGDDRLEQAVAWAKRA